MLYKVALTFGSDNEILKYDHSNESYWVVRILSCGAVYYAVLKVGQTLESKVKSLSITIQMKATVSSSFLWFCLLYCTRWF